MYQGVLHLFRYVCFMPLRAHNGAKYNAGVWGFYSESSIAVVLPVIVCDLTRGSKLKHHICLEQISPPPPLLLLLLLLILRGADWRRRRCLCQHAGRHRSSLPLCCCCVWREAPAGGGTTDLRTSWHALHCLAQSVRCLPSGGDEVKTGMVHLNCPL